MIDYVEMMKEFHKTFDVPISKEPKLINDNDFIRRLSLISSENGELNDAVRQKDIVEIADALGDLLYVVFGMAVEMGLDIDEIFKQIHKSNMSKANADGTVTKDVGGKIIKSANYKPVDLSWIKDHMQKEIDFTSAGTPKCFGNPVHKEICNGCLYEKKCNEAICND